MLNVVEYADADTNNVKLYKTCFTLLTTTTNMSDARCDR